MKVIDRILIYISLVALPFFAVSCAEKEMGDLSAGVTYGVYFPVQNGTGDIQLSPDDPRSFSFTVRRLVTKGDLTVPVKIESEHQGIFSTTELYFEEDSPVAELEVFFPTIKQGVTYDCTLYIDGDKYVSQYSKNASHLTFSVTSVKWNKVIGDNGQTTGLWRDGLFALFYTTMPKPNHERAVEVYERDDKPGYYRIYDVYNASYVGEMFGFPNASGVCLEKHYTYIDATDPDKVWIPTFKTGVLLSPNDGAISIGSYVAENKDFDASISSIYGKLKDGVITFPAGSLWLHFGSYGWYSSNSFGLHRIVLPGYSVPDTEIDLKASMTDDQGRVPVDVGFGLDIYKVYIHTKRGTFTGTELAAVSDSLAAQTKEPNQGAIFSSQLMSIEPVDDNDIRNNTAAITGEYSLLAVGVDRKGNMVGYNTVTFGYKANKDDKPVEINYGIICSNKYASEGKTDNNTFEIYINGKNIKNVHIGLFEKEKYDADKEYYDKVLDQSTLAEESLAKINGEGLTLIQTGLAPGTPYVMLIKADNGYSAMSDTVVESTKGAWDYRLAYYSAADVDKAKIETIKSAADYCGTYTYYAIGAYNTSRTYQGEVTVEMTDMVYNTYPCVKVTGLFPFFRKTYKVKDDAMYFYYKGGELYNYDMHIESFIYEGMFVYPSALLLSSDGYAYSGYGGLKATFVRKDKEGAGSCLAFVDAGEAAQNGISFTGIALFGSEDSDMKSPIGYLDVVESMVMINKADDPNPLLPPDSDDEEEDEVAKTKINALGMKSHMPRTNYVEAF